MDSKYMEVKMSSVWVVDADGIESENDGIKNVLKTMKVKAFLEDEKKLGIAAARGLGKTFLLKVKRNQFQRKSGVICIPSNSMVDVVYSPKFNSANSNFYNNYNNWCHLWEVALAASIINELRCRQQPPCQLHSALRCRSCCPRKPPAYPLW